MIYALSEGVSVSESTYVHPKPDQAYLKALGGVTKWVNKHAEAF